MKYSINEVFKTILNFSPINDIDKEKHLKQKLNFDLDLEKDLGYDSMSLINLIVEIESKYNIEFNDELLLNNITVRDICNNINS